MDHFHFPVSLGTVLVSWNFQGLLTQITWSPTRFAFFHKTRIPCELMGMIDGIRSFFYEGQPIGSIPWDLIDQSRWSDFQREVYMAASNVPHGDTRTYGWIAQQLGKPLAARAVGQALRKNPVPILVPCHRILGCKSLGGFMGQTQMSDPMMQLKSHLLGLEEEYCSPVFSFVSSRYGQTTSAILRK